MSWGRLALIVPLLALLLAPLPAAPSRAAPAPDAPPASKLSYVDGILERQAFARTVDGLLDKGDFAALNALARSLRASDARFSDGSRKDSFIYYSIMVSDDEQACDPCWRYLDDLSQRWIAATPAVSTPYIVRANLLLSRAAGYRGTGWAQDVPPAVWPLIHKLAGEAQDLLARKRDIVRTDPYYYCALARMAAFNGGTPDVNETLAKGVAAFPGFAPLYLRAAVFTLPAWGGSYAALDRLARQAAKNTAATDKSGLFYRVYRVIHEVHQFGSAVDDDGVDRPMLLRSMRDVASQYPVDYNYVEFIYMACRIGYDDEARRYAAMMKDKTSEQAKPIQDLAQDCDSVAKRKRRQTAAL